MEFLLDIVRCNSSQDRKVEEEEKKEERGEEWNFELHRAPLAAWKGKEIYAIVPGTYPVFHEQQKISKATIFLSARYIRGGGGGGTR